MTTQTTALTIHTPKGTAVEVVIATNGDHMPDLTVTVPSIGLTGEASGVGPLPKPVPGHTHQIPLFHARKDGQPAGSVRLAIGPDAARALQTAIDTAQETARAAHLATPQGQADALRAGRAQLVEAIAAAFDADREARERAFRRDIGGVPAYGGAAVQRAEAALSAFDAAHPEVAAAVRAERDTRETELARRAWEA